AVKGEDPAGAEHSCMRTEVRLKQVRTDTTPCPAQEADCDVPARQPRQDGGGKVTFDEENLVSAMTELEPLRDNVDAVGRAVGQCDRFGISADYLRQRFSQAPRHLPECFVRKPGRLHLHAGRELNRAAGRPRKRPLMRGVQPGPALKWAEI